MRKGLPWVLLVVGCLDPVAGGRDGGTDADRPDVAADTARPDVSADAPADVPIDMGFDAATCDLTRWPDRPDIEERPGNNNRFYALRNIVLDQSDSTLGYDVDGFCTTSPEEEAECTLDGTDVVLDGPGGVDNSFGANLLPIINAFRPSFEDDVRGRMEMGETIILRIGLSSLETSDRLTSMAILRPTGRVRGGDDRTTPQWDGGDVYELDPRSYTVLGMDPMPRIEDRVSYVNERVMAANITANQPIYLPWLDGGRLALPLATGKVIVRFSEDYEHIEEGVIQGRIEPRTLQVALEGAGICAGGPLRQMLDDAMPNARDLVRDPRSIVPDALCESISVAFRFTGRRAIFAEIAPEEPTDPPPMCLPGV